jgi:hypothetical protein
MALTRKSCVVLLAFMAARLTALASAAFGSRSSKRLVGHCRSGQFSYPAASTLHIGAALLCSRRVDPPPVADATVILSPLPPRSRRVLCDAYLACVWVGGGWEGGWVCMAHVRCRVCIKSRQGQAFARITSCVLRVAAMQGQHNKEILWWGRLA